MNEDQFTDTVVEMAKLYRWRVVHFRKAQVRPGKWVTPVKGHTGSPDLLLARGGVVILAELKTDRGRMGPGQVEWGQEIGPTHYRLWRPRDMKQIVEELR